MGGKGGRGRGEECSISPLSRQWYSLLHMVLLTTLSGTRPFAACNKKNGIQWLSPWQKYM